LHENYKFYIPYTYLLPLLGGFCRNFKTQSGSRKKLHWCS